MALEDFRVEGIGQVSQVYIGVDAKEEVVAAPTPNDHTAIDQYDSDGNAIVWTQPQPKIEIYKLILSAAADATVVISCDDGTTEIMTLDILANVPFVLGSEPTGAKAIPLFVCNSGTNFTIGSTSTPTFVYAQYQTITPRN